MDDDIQKISSEIANGEYSNNRKKVCHIDLITGRNWMKIGLQRKVDIARRIRWKQDVGKQGKNNH